MIVEFHWLVDVEFVRVSSIAFCHFRVFQGVESLRRALSRCELCKSLARMTEYHSQIMNANSAKSPLVFCLKPFLRDSNNLNSFDKHKGVR